MWLSIIAAYRNFLLFLHYSSLLFYIFSIRNFVNYKHLLCPIWSVFLVKCLYLVFLCSHLITNFEFWFLSCMHITKSIGINSSHHILCFIVLFYHSTTLDFSSFSVEYIPMLYLFNKSLRCL